jgi:dipeptidase
MRYIFIGEKFIFQYNMKSKTMKIKKYSNKRQTKKQFFFNPKNPDKSFDVYIDKNPKDTIPIHYKTLEDVKITIHKLEKLYKSKKYNHKRIWQVGMIMKVRLEVLKKKKPEQYKLSKKYFEFLGKRTGMDEKERYHSIFKY